MSPRIRIVLEIAAIIGLAFGIYHYRGLFFGEKKPPVERPQPSDDDGGGKVEILRASKDKGDTDKADPDPRAGADEPATTEPGTLETTPTAPPPGTLELVVTDEAGGPVTLDGWLIGAGGDLRLPIVSGRVVTELPPIRTKVVAHFEIEGEAVTTEPVDLVVVSGEITSLAIPLPPPPLAHTGLILSKIGEMAEVIDVVEGSSAAKQGLQVGDVVLKLGDYLVADLNAEDVANVLLGEPDTALPVVLVVEDNGELIPGAVDLVRDTPVE